MQTNNGCFQKGLAFVFAGVLVMLLPAALFGFNLPFVLLNADSYNRALEDQDFYPVAIDLLAEEIADSFAYADDPAGEETYHTALQALLGDLEGEQWLQEELEKVLEAVFAYLNGRTDELHTEISILPLLERLEGPEGVQILQDYMAALPACTLEDVGYLLEFVTNPDDFQLPYCTPPIDQIEPLMEAMRDAFVVSMQAVDEEFPIDAVPDETDMEILQAYRVTRWVLLLSPLFILGLVVVILALAVRSVEGLLTWTGIPFGIGSLLALLSGAMGYFTAKARLQEAVVELFGEDLPVRMANVLGGVIEQVTSRYLGLVSIEAGVLLALSTGAVLVGVVTARMQDSYE